MKGLKGLSLLLLVSLGVIIMVVAGAEDAEGATITVPDDYPTIQSAIENATDYDTLFIKDGLYLESIVVWRPLTIMGESQAGTVIENDDPFGVLIVSHRASLSDVTVQGTSVGAGLILQGSNCVIEDVTVRDCLWGLWVNRGTNNVVRNVDCLDNDWQGVLVEEADNTLLEGVTCSGNNDGIHVRAAVGTTIKGCTSEQNREHGILINELAGTYQNKDVSVLNCLISNNSANGVEVSDTDGVLVQGCTVSDSLWSAMRFDRCNDVVVRGNHVRNFVRLGIAFQGPGSKGCIIEENEIIDEGAAWSKIIVHNAEDIIIRENYVNALSSAISVHMANNTLVSDNLLVSTNDNASVETVGIIVGRHRAGVLLPPTNVTLLGNEVRGYTEGIWIRGGWDIDIIDCTVKEAGVGIAFSVFDHGDDPIVGGLVKGCTLVGCGMVIEGMTDVAMEDNTIDGADVGIYFNATTHDVKDNLFTRNIIMDCTGYGLSFNSTDGTNRFHLNTFINNAEHSSTPFDDDAFDDGMMYGNYWDDYEERYPNAIIDGRVWDTPYSVGGGTVMDRYPLAFAHDTQAPVADAGEQQGGEVGSTYLLNGTGSWDNGVIVRYTWTFTYADTPVELEGETATFPFLLVGSYAVTLEVEDAWGNTDVNQTMVHIHDLTDPNANAGDDIEVGMGVQFMFDGAASTDNGFIVAWEWHVDPGGLDRVVMGETATFTIDGPGEYPVVLKVIDEVGNWAIDDMLVNVLDNEAPVADAGRDFASDQGVSVTLSGRWSTDNVGVTSWTWTFTEDGQVVIELGENVERVFAFAGVYEIFLNVSDEADNWDVDQMTLIITDIEPPMADAGPNIQVVQGTLVTLDGTGSTDNVEIIAFNWIFAENSLIKSIMGAEPSYEFDIPGEYELELRVYDAEGNLGLDWVIVTVDEVFAPMIARWTLGPFKDDKGALGGVRVEVTLGGNSYVAYTDDDGDALFIVAVEDLVSPATVVAEKEGWKTIEFDVELDPNGDATGTIPVMKRETGGDGDDDDDDDDDETDWLAWGLVIVLVIAFGGTLLYLSNVAKRNE